MSQQQLKKIAIDTLFNDNTSYLIPIYQRNYAWRQQEIDQLIDDISDKSSDNDYFLGTLVVYDQADLQVLEVIDGQQRLTTLYLLWHYLGLSPAENSLQFEARDQSNEILKSLATSQELDNKEKNANRLLIGLRLIQNYFKNNKIDKKHFINLMQSVYLVQVPLPQTVNLNHYFELMNTRGEQLELHEIAKSHFLAQLSDKEQVVANMIWQNCSQMDHYIQTRFIPEIRKKLFGTNYMKLPSQHFDEIMASIGDVQSSSGTQKQTLEGLFNSLEKSKTVSASKPVPNSEIDESEGSFASIIKFPHFLLHVHAVLAKKNNQTPASLDDRSLLIALAPNWKDKESAKEFLAHMLLLRTLFDRYIIKRESNIDDTKDNALAIKTITKPKKDQTYQYTQTYKHKEKISLIQSCLRITFTSARTMHWLTEVLYLLLTNTSDIQQHNGGDRFACHLEQFIAKHIESDVAMLASNQLYGFDIPHIIFNYLDYLLYVHNYADIQKNMPQWFFRYRNSIDHFHPQNPDTKDHWEDQALHHFGNLSLTSVEHNSKFSNQPVAGKVKYSNIIKQSPKLFLMSKLAGKWSPKVAQTHGQKMIEFIQQHINSLLSSNP